MSLELIRLLIDFGLVVLIFLVQLIIYPSFFRMSVENLKSWHPIYTKRITLIVLPLMISQAAIVLWQTLAEFSYPNLTSLLIVISLWLLTFLQSVPLHSKIDNSETPIKAAKELLQANRVRLFLWTMLFIFNLVEFLN